MFRSKKHCKSHLQIEWTIFKYHFPSIFVLAIAQWWHSVATNIVYFLSSKYMSSAQRQSLFDFSFYLLPRLKGFLWALSDWIVYAMIFHVALLALGRIFWEHGGRRGGSPYSSMNGLYATLIIRRYFLTITVCQQLRIISFLTTLLPSPR